ncbi:MAG: VCBS repeat-containing protein, partial [Thermoplasmata archaeon]|nr:VCBS repeat-containing protein [Thermoplasmata archaeon]
MKYATIFIALSLLIISFSVSIDMEAEGVPINALETGYSSGLPTSGDYNAIAVGDVDGDGNTDMAFGGEDYGSANTQGLYVYKGNGAGTWTSTSTGLPTADSWGGTAFGDADGDGNVELYACNDGWGTDTGSIKGIGAWEYSSGSWSSSGISSPLTSGLTNGLYLGNFTKGTGLDIALTHSTGNAVGIKAYYGSGSSPISWTGNSAGLPTSGEYAGIDVGDLNGDGLPDIASVAYSSTGLVIYTQDSDGNGWTSRSSSLPSSVKRTGLGVVLGDVNNDGDLDIIMGTRDNGMRFLMGNGGGATGTDFSWTAGSFPSNFGSSGRFAQMDLEDIDHDGDLDLLAGKAGSGLYLFLGNGSDSPGTSFAWTQVTGLGLPTGGTYYGCQFLDVDNDDDLDISGATWGSGVKVYRTNLTWGEVNNSSPMPDAGVDQEVMLGEVVALDGTGSSDPEDAPGGDPAGDLLTYNWNVSSYPSGSLIRDASLSPNQFSAAPSFTPDTWGTYVLTLAVKDSRDAWSNQSDEDNVTITVIKPDDPPIADAGSDRSVTVGSIVVLNGSRSSDPDGTVEHFN